MSGDLSVGKMSSWRNRLTSGSSGCQDAVILEAGMDSLDVTAAESGTSDWQEIQLLLPLLMKPSFITPSDILHLMDDLERMRSTCQAPK